MDVGLDYNCIVAEEEVLRRDACEPRESEERCIDPSLTGEG